MFVAYYRVSTKKQGASGLGLEAQQAAVRAYCKEPIIAEFTEIESGKNSKRPELAAAMALAKRRKATLVIAKLDRLSRNLHFITGIIESKAKFIALDNPDADIDWLQLSGYFAERERRMISARTKAALAAAKARGTQLGKHGATLALENRTQADAFATSMATHIDAARASGALRAPAIAAYLNAMAIPTARGGAWHTTTIARLISRIDGISQRV